MITHPLPVWFPYYFSMFAFFLTFALGFAMRHMWVMDLVNLAFFFASTLFWWPIVGHRPDPHWAMSHGAQDDQPASSGCRSSRSWPWPS